MTFDYRSVMSGERRDPLAMLMRVGLRIAGGGYGFAIRRRNRGYDSGKREIHDCGVPVISVGNLTTGGTGKTPIVCFLARTLRAQGLRVAIISRGYGRGDADANDEAMELHDRLPDVPHIQDPDRVEAARIAVEELESQVLLMDDGFQHRRLHRNLDIVVIDVTCPFGYGHVLPRGLLREPISGLTRADLVIMTRCDAVSEEVLESITRSIHQVAPELPIVRSRHMPTTLFTHPDRNDPIERLRGQTVAVLSAIGNPDAFRKTVEHCGAEVTAAKSLPDHDDYSPETVRELATWAKSLNNRASQVVCTHKDLVKLRTDRLGGLPLSAVLIDLEIIEGANLIDPKLQQVVRQGTGD
tara:strand:- start:181095 stop:182159 length:1065 start_codon:yes stop_codon:yes gene_type:complete